MKDAFWTAGVKKAQTAEHVENAIAAKRQAEQPKPKPPPPPLAPALRKCKDCGRMTANPCRP